MFLGPSSATPKYVCEIDVPGDTSAEDECRELE